MLILRKPCYAGEYLDSETGLVYLRARYYQPISGRFIIADTYWNARNNIYGNVSSNNPMPSISTIMQSSNLYVYCVNNPIRYIDPNGHKRIDSIYLHVYSKTTEGQGMVHNAQSMTKVIFTNLNTELYTIDGKFFHTDPQALIDGEHLYMQDPDNLLNNFRYDPKLEEPFLAATLEKVSEMDKELGKRIFWEYAGAIFSGVGDLAGGIVKYGEFAGKAIPAAIEVTDLTLTWAGRAEAGINILQEPATLGDEVQNLIPIWGTFKAFQGANKKRNYVPSFK